MITLLIIGTILGVLFNRYSLDKEGLSIKYNSGKTEINHLLDICYGSLILLEILYKAIHFIFVKNIKIPGGRIPDTKEEAKKIILYYLFYYETDKKTTNNRTSR